MNNFVKVLMDEIGLKQNELAAILGITTQAISQWNNECTNIKPEHLFSLSKLFHITVDELLEGKRIGESLEDKWKREYDINEEAARTAQIDEDKEALLHCFETVTKANDRFFTLLEKKIKEKITASEIKELEFLKQFYEIGMKRQYLYGCVQVNGCEIDISAVIDDVKAKVGKDNYEVILWELKNRCKIIDFEIDQSILDDFDDDVFYAWYNILTPIEKDWIINDEVNRNRDKYQRIDHLYELIKRGGNILYAPTDLNIMNYDYKDLDDFEGKVKSIPELDKAQAVIYEIYDKYPTTYEQHQALINRPWMRQIEMEAKYKEKNPIKYWEYIKNNKVLI